MINVNNIRIRDPYIVATNGLYYMYSSNDNTIPNPQNALRMVVYISEDMVNWSEPKVAFEYIPTDLTKIKAELWATEVHFYKGKYYAFMSFRNHTEKRGTYIAVSDKPDGKFVLMSDSPLTPLENSCIDGTLYLENDIPYIVYSLDWPYHYVPQKKAYVGEIWARELSKDLSKGIGKPFKLFSSDDCPISRATPHHMIYNDEKIVRYGSDAPFLIRLSNNQLMITWSPYLQNNYVVLGAISKSGSIKDHWEHLAEPIFDDNGGHAMFFKDYDGTMKMCIHQPEKGSLERMLCLTIEEKDGIISAIYK